MKGGDEKRKEKREKSIKEEESNERKGSEI